MTITYPQHGEENFFHILYALLRKWLYTLLESEPRISLFSAAICIFFTSSSPYTFRFKRIFAFPPISFVSRSRKHIIGFSSYTLRNMKKWSCSIKNVPQATANIEITEFVLEFFLFLSHASNPMPSPALSLAPHLCLFYAISFYIHKDLHFLCIIWKAVSHLSICMLVKWMRKSKTIKITCNTRQFQQIQWEYKEWLQNVMRTFHDSRAYVMYQLNTNTALYQLYRFIPYGSREFLSIKPLLQVEWKIDDVRKVVQQNLPPLLLILSVNIKYFDSFIFFLLSLQ